MNDLSRYLGKRLLPTYITVRVMTVGGVNENGEEVDEPVVFEGSYNEALDFWYNEVYLRRVEQVVREMPDGYIEVETGTNSRQVYSAYDVLDTIDEIL